MSEIRVNNIIDEAGTGAPTFPNGATGNLTGNVTGTADLASGLTGTPNITVGTVTGTDATFSGNLTVQGTTTTIDTAVTSVDSLQVDGSVGIGTTDPSGFFVNDLVVGDGSASNKGITVFTGNSNVGYLLFADGKTGSERYKGQLAYNHSNNSLNLYTYDDTDIINLGTDNTTRVTIDGNGTTKFNGPLTEKCHRDTGGGLTGDYNHDLITYGNVHWATSNSAGTWTYNLRGSATVELNDMMSDSESLSFQLISAQNSTSNYMTAFKIDGSSSHTVFWQGGSAPSEGGGSGYDVYTFTVFKIGNASFRTFASLSNHA